MKQAKQMSNKDLVYAAVLGYDRERFNSQVWGREESASYQYAKGYLVGVLTAFNLSIEETIDEIIIRYTNSGRTMLRYRKTRLGEVKESDVYL